MKDKVIDLYETASLLVVHIGKYGEIDSRHALTSRLSNALEALDGGVHDIECLKDLSTLHTIKPLEWKKSIATLQSGNQDVDVETPFGKYYVVEYDKDDFLWGIDGKEVPYDCDSIEDGKAQAEKHYMEQIGKCLEVYDG